MSEERFEQLMDSYLSCRLTDEEKAELVKWLDEESSHRTRFREAVELEHALVGQLGANELAEADDLFQLVEEPSTKRAAFSSAFRKWEHAGVAALFVLCLSLGWMLWSGARKPDGVNDFGDGAGSMARLIRVSEDAVFSSDHEMPSREGSFLGKGWMQLEQGSIEIVFHSGATVDLTGPAVFGIDTSMRGFLDSGQASVHAPEEARDFVVGTASMEVVDLGTRFNLSVDPNSSAAAVSVTEGLVNLHLGGEGTPRRIQPLPAGLLAQVNGAGEIISIDGKPLNSELGLGSGLLAHWTLDDLATDGRTPDSSGNERSALFHGDPAKDSVPGQSGRALDLSQGQYLDISDHIPAMTEVSTFTFAAWVRGARGIVFSFSDGSPRNRVQFELHGNRLLYGWQQGARFDAIQGRVPGWEKGHWHHVAVSVSGGSLTIYRDGLALNSQSLGQKISSNTFALIDVKGATLAFIGRLPSNHSQLPQTLGGQIDDVQFYRQALDEQAVRYLYEHPGEAYHDQSLNLR